MKALFTRNNSPLSRLIRFLTREDVSHCAIESGPVVYHSNLLGGVHLETSKHFRSRNIVVYEVELADNLARLEHALDKYELAGYDYLGLIYLGLRCVLRFLPKANLWQSSGMLLCTEWAQEVIEGEMDSSMTPYQLYKHLKGDL